MSTPWHIDGSPVVGPPEAEQLLQTKNSFGGRVARVPSCATCMRRSPALALVATVVTLVSASAAISHAQPSALASGLSLRGGEMVSASKRGGVLACGGSVSDGRGFSAAVVDGGKLFMWGCGDSGALGAVDGSIDPQHVPAEVLGLRDKTVVHVACGGWAVLVPHVRGPNLKYVYVRVHVSCYGGISVCCLSLRLPHRFHVSHSNACFVRQAQCGDN